MSFKNVCSLDFSAAKNAISHISYPVQPHGKKKGQKKKAITF